MQPFYTDGRRFLQLSIDRIDELLASGAKATFDNGTVTFTVPDGDDVYAKARIASHRRAAAWVNNFNQRSVNAHA